MSEIIMEEKMKRYLLCCVVIFTSCKGTDKSATARTGDLDVLEAHGSESTTIPESSEKPNPETPNAPVGTDSVFTLKEGDSFIIESAELSSDGNNVTVLFVNGTVTKSVQLPLRKEKDLKITKNILNNLTGVQHFGQVVDDKGGELYAFAYIGAGVKNQKNRLVFTIDNKVVLYSKKPGTYSREVCYLPIIGGRKTVINKSLKVVKAPSSILFHNVNEGDFIVVPS
jgi:hypothetical protein